MPPCLEHSSITSSRISESQLGLVSAMPLKRFVLLHVIKRTSRTFPTLEKNSSKSRARTRCDNCIQNTVRASRSSGLSSESGDLSGPRPLGGKCFYAKLPMSLIDSQSKKNPLCSTGKTQSTQNLQKGYAEELCMSFELPTTVYAAFQSSGRENDTIV
uniref:Uncharacterized protein n=1 Tax=Glossina palpalis gambiensis TaxID=67801 RepID=A0A1B0BVM7_9MUSC